MTFPLSGYCLPSQRKLLLPEKNMWEAIRGYLTFTRKERIGVLFLLLITGVLFVLPYFFRPKPGSPDPETYKKYKDSIEDFSRETSAQMENDGRRKAGSGLTEVDSVHRTQKISYAVFYFNPNTLGISGWRRLGLPERQVLIIDHFLQRGGQFRKPEDLKKIYGLREEDYRRLFPYLQIPAEENFIQSQRKGSGKLQSRKDEYPQFIVRNFPDRIRPLDINEADSTAWSSLPGIGARFAQRILRFRDRLGGFSRIDQVGETYGMTDSCFQKIRPHLKLGDRKPRQIDLNHAEAEEMQAHPYIRWKLSKEILNYRREHGPFHSVDEILKLAQIDSAQYEKLHAYLTLGP